MATNENLPPNVIKQLAKELKNLDQSPPEGIKVSVNEDDFSTIFAEIEGPVGTPYENGFFRMKLILSRDFPHSPPKGYFLTKIFHPNIASTGDICVNTLKKDWNPSLGLRHVLIVVRCLLIEPFPESALNEKAGKMLIENYEEYAKLARLHTELHATKTKSKFKTGAISESTTALNIDQSNASNLHTELHATKTKSKFKTGAISESTTALNIDQSNASNLNVDEKSGNALPLPLGSATTSAKVNSLPSSSVAPPHKKEVGIVKPLPDKKKMDARKKSLKRL